MQAAFEVGLAAEQDPKVHKNSLVRDFEESLQWWLFTRPEVFKYSVRFPSISTAAVLSPTPLHAILLPRMSWL